MGGAPAAAGVENGASTARHRMDAAGRSSRPRSGSSRRRWRSALTNRNLREGRDRSNRRQRSARDGGGCQTGTDNAAAVVDGGVPMNRSSCRRGIASSGRQREERAAGLHWPSGPGFRRNAAVLQGRGSASKSRWPLAGAAPTPAVAAARAVGRWPALDGSGRHGCGGGGRQLP